MIRGCPDFLAGLQGGKLSSVKTVQQGTPAWGGAEGDLGGRALDRGGVWSEGKPRGAESWAGGCGLPPETARRVAAKCSKGPGAGQVPGPSPRPGQHADRRQLTPGLPFTQRPPSWVIFTALMARGASKMGGHTPMGSHAALGLGCPSSRSLPCPVREALCFGAGRLCSAGGGSVEHGGL